MKELIFEHECGSRAETLRVVYIEYQNNKPFACIASPIGRDWQNHFDIEIDCYDHELLMYYNSGSGGTIREIQAPHYTDDYKGASYWMHPEASFKEGTDAVNCKRLKNPKTFNGSKNPLNENTRQVYGMDYCKFCEKWYDEDSCPEHHVFEDGELKYFDGSETE